VRNFIFNAVSQTLWMTGTRQPKSRYDGDTPIPVGVAEQRLTPGNREVASGKQQNRPVINLERVSPSDEFLYKQTAEFVHQSLGNRYELGSPNLQREVPGDDDTGKCFRRRSHSFLYRLEDSNTERGALVCLALMGVLAVQIDRQTINRKSRLRLWK
jgi:hypothetical protein